MDLYHHSDPAFTKWVVAERLLSESFVIIDVGVQGGEHPRWEFLGSYAEVHGFDPIAEVIDELQQSEIRSQRRYYHNLALGNEDGQRLFFLSPERFSSSFFRTGVDGEKQRLVDVRRLDSLYREGAIPRADYLKLDCEGFEPEILRGARKYLSNRDIICVTTETNFNVSPTLPYTHFHAVNEVLAEHCLLVYDINEVRSPTPEYLAALAARHQLQPSQDKGSPLAVGRPGTCDVLFCRDLVAEQRDPDTFIRADRRPRPPSTDTIIKAMINFELHGLMDCAVELAVTFRELLAERLNVERAIELLLLPAPAPRNTLDVTMTLAKVAEAEARLGAERNASVARIRELEAMSAADHDAFAASYRRLNETFDAEREAFVARIRELEATLSTERDSVIARLRGLASRTQCARRLHALKLRLRNRASRP
jgi:FkbM family methyltransferase